MGILINNANELADYSGTGLGTTDWVKNFLPNLGISDPVKINALVELRDASVSAGIWSLIDILGFFPGSGSLTQRKIAAESGAELTFIGSGGIGSAGYTSGIGRYAEVPFSMPSGNITKFSIGIYNAVADINSGINVMISAKDGTGPQDYAVLLGRNIGSTTYGRISKFSAAISAQTDGSYDRTKTGFLQAVLDGTTLTLLDNGTSIATNTTNVPIGGGGAKVIIGGSKDPGAAFTNFSGATFTGYYVGRLTVAQAQTWDTLFRAFITAYGRP